MLCPTRSFERKEVVAVGQRLRLPNGWKAAKYRHRAKRQSGGAVKRWTGEIYHNLIESYHRSIYRTRLRSLKGYKLAQVTVRLYNTY